MRFDQAIFLVTRPQAQSDSLVALFNKAGLEVHALPCQEIVPLADVSRLGKAWQHITSYDWVGFVSPNAIEQAFRYWQGDVTSFQQIQFMLLGPGSEKILRQYVPNACVVKPLSNQSLDSESLLTQLPSDFEHQRVLMIRGKEGRKFLVDELRVRGAIVDEVACYEQRCPILRDEQAAFLKQLANTQRQVVAIVASSQACQNLVALCKACQLDDWIKQQTLIVTHQNILQHAKSIGFMDVELCLAGDENFLKFIVDDHV